MVQVAGYYDENAAPQADFEPVPAGEYVAQIIDSEMEDVSKRNNMGRCLKLTWQIHEGEYEGRLVWQRLNLWAENMNNLDKVIMIANQQFAAIREAVGVQAVQDTDELHHRPALIRVSVKIDKTGQYAPQNEVKAVKPINGGGGASQQHAPVQQRSVQAPQQSPQQTRPGPGAPPANRQPAQAAAGGGLPWGGRR